MPKQYSIADARRSLPGLVDEAEAGAAVQLTRRGRAVAVIVSVDEYARLKQDGRQFKEAFATFSEKFPAGRAELRASDLSGLRSRAPGRAVKL